MKQIILTLLMTAALVACSTIAEDNNNCPAEMRVSFHLDDKHEPGDYDTRIGNDVLINIFKDKKLIRSKIIPYQTIRNNAEFVINKMPDLFGEIELVAWAVPSGNIYDYLPGHAIGDAFDDKFLMLDPETRQQDRSSPCNPDLYLGRVSTVEEFSQASHHNVGMTPAACRIEVRVKDNLEKFTNPGSNPCALVEGVMSQMNLNRQGTGSLATVRVPFNMPTDGTLYTTGRFGVFPSAAGQRVSVQIMSGGSTIAILTVPEDNLPRGAVSGGLITFYYELNAPYFEIMVEGWTQKLYTVKYI